MKTKKCYSCDKIKPLEEYHKSRNEKDGHAYECKECKNARNVQYRIDNIEKISKYNKKYYSNPDARKRQADWTKQPHVKKRLQLKRKANAEQRKKKNRAVLKAHRAQASGLIKKQTKCECCNKETF
jgi:hypothetical protein